MEDVVNRTLRDKLFHTVGEPQVQWTPPPTDFVRVDVDASVQQNQYATCGGVIQNSQGEWIKGFHKELGHMSAVTAGIHAIRLGLEVFKCLGFTRVKLYSDSLESINMLTRDGGVDNRFRDVLEETRNIMSSYIHQAYRQGIRVANLLARNAHGMGENLMVVHILWSLMLAGP
ncbi:uncharacterized protein LOC129286497 [Prosopis cineraria]|uniref:uncharacterized protein LOC129286497 n=1 Tax=Prosopis cineraria TaxID=364024 RepID=UPI00240F2E39|nr:uncharacterized protein LOC129286497 [Prosopis cineraria]